MIAEDGDGTSLDQWPNTGDDGLWIGPIAHEITEEGKAVRSQPPSGGETGLERRQICMDIGEQGDPHG
jgi:hypothetical protein